MKAIIIATDEIIDFKGSSVEHGTSTWIDSKNMLHQEFLPKGGIKLIDDTKEIDWEKRNYELIKSMTQGMLANSKFLEECERLYYRNSLKYPCGGFEDYQKVAINDAIRYADELIKRLKQTKP